MSATPMTGQPFSLKLLDGGTAQSGSGSRQQNQRGIAMSEHKFRQGCYLPAGLDPNKVGVELERLSIKYDGLTPAKVVVAAKPKSSPLHQAFTWDDSEAARKMREHEARQLIRSVVIINPDRAEHPQFTHVTRVVGGEVVDKENVYLPTISVVADHDLFTDALGKAIGRITEAQRQVTDLQQVAKDNARLGIIQKASGYLLAAHQNLEKLRQ